MLPIRHLAGAALTLAALVTAAAERRAPEPWQGPIPVVHTASTADEARGGTNAAIAVDLTLGHDGLIVQAPSDAALAPGRYRLHAVVGSTPHDHLLVESVSLKLTAAKTTEVFERQARFPEDGTLSQVHLDFIVDQAGPVEIRAEWLVGDSKLDRQRYRDEGEARRVYRAQRQDAINQYLIQHPPKEAAGDDELGLGELIADERPRYRMQGFAAADLPPYHLLLTSLVIERLTPVEIRELHTDQPAYEPGAKGRASALLVNRAAEPVSLELWWCVYDSDGDGTPLLEHTETLDLAAGQELDHPLAVPFPTDGIELAGELQLSLKAGELGPIDADRPFVILPPPRAPYPRDKRIFAHYMACWPIGYGALPWELRNEGQHLKHESTDEKIRRGGHVRNYPLAPPEMSLTPEASADLEIRRAMRIGIDGFAIDAWAGGDNAMKTFDALIRTAAAKDYPFEVTICIDPSCGGRLVDTVKWLLDNYGDHPKLARRDGKPLIFGYFSQGPAFGFANARLSAVSDAEKQAVRTSPLGWHLAGLAFRDAERAVGQPIFYHFSYEYLFHPYKDVSDDTQVAAVGAIARHVGAVGSFGSTGQLGGRVAEAVKASGAEWSGGCGMYQKENIPFEVYSPPGTDWLEGSWRGLREQDATLPQLITWNDYGENTNIAPAWETRYTLYDLTGYHIAWWKTGQPPAVDHDRLYLTYAKYPRDATVWPFAQGVARPRQLEVLTILTAPAVVRLPGREIEFEAPAGYSRRQFPLTVGPVVAELVRDGQVVTRLESPEPITDRPFRESNGLICFSTEFMRHWQADFGDAKPFLYGEYADDDGDGLPNWFEMYWFTEERSFKPVASTDAADLLDQPAEHPVTRWLDFATMTAVEPDADPNRDGKTNLDSYRERIDPTRPAPPKIDGNLP